MIGFGYISGRDFPDWVYHHFDRQFNEHTASSLCSVEILAIESITGRKLTNTSGGSTLQVPVSLVDGDDDAVSFECMHYRSQHFIRIPMGLGKRVPHMLPLWCISPPSYGDENLLRRNKQACNALESADLRLELFVKSHEAKPDVDVTTHFTTTMGSYPVAMRPDLSEDIVTHAVMPYHKVDLFNKVVFHMWLSYHALMGFYIVSSIPNVGFYDELPKFVANHPNIAHYDSTLLKAVHLDSPAQYNNPYVVEFEKMMLATFVRFEYRVLYHARFVVNADPDEFVMAPHGPGFDLFKFSPFKEFNESMFECNPALAKKVKPRHQSLQQNALMLERYLESKYYDINDTAALSKRFTRFGNEKVNIVQLKLSNWKFTNEDITGIELQAKYVKWLVNEVFAFSVKKYSTMTNLLNFYGKAIEVVLHKQYVSTVNTTTACITDMISRERDDVYTFSKCFDYLSVMHPGTNPNYLVRSKYININQGCLSDTIHYSCVQNNHYKFKKYFSSSTHCMCHKVINQPYVFLMHFRENGKSGGHSLHKIRCDLVDHEDTVYSDFRKKKLNPKFPYIYDQKTS